MTSCVSCSASGKVAAASVSGAPLLESSVADGPETIPAVIDVADVIADTAAAAGGSGDDVFFPKEVS